MDICLGQMRQANKLLYELLNEQVHSHVPHFGHTLLSSLTAPLARKQTNSAYDDAFFIVDLLTNMASKE